MVIIDQMTATMRHYSFIVLMALCLTANAKTGKEIIAENGFRPKVEPMLVTKWSQDGGENSMLPCLYGEGSERAVTGCGATATAQLLNYWHSEIKFSGDNYYVWTSPLNEKLVLYADFQGTEYDWDNMIAQYKNNDAATQMQIEAVSTLMLHVGTALEMKFDTASATQIEYIHTALKKFFGFNPYSRLVRFVNGAYSMDEWLTMVYRELSEGRIVLMDGYYESESKKYEHIYLADGYDEEGRVHLNQGKADLGFNRNTYYDLTSEGVTYTGDMRMIIGICPDPMPAETTTVNVTAAGTLMETLGGELASRRICRLKVNGVLNASDVKWLNELSQITTGQLSYLDLSDCDIEGNTLPSSAFDGCLALQEIILPNSLEAIGSKVFRNCNGLYKVHLPPHLSRIDSYAFTGCRYLEDIILPSSVRSIGNNPFRYDKLDRFEIDADNASHTIVNHALLTKDGKKLLSMPFKCLGEYAVPDGVETIGVQAFLKSCMMASVTLPASLKKIQANAFLECYSLKDVYSHASQAPAIEGDSFDPSISACTLHVPKGCIDEYRQKHWDVFATIVDDIITEGVRTVMEASGNSFVRYSITGQRIMEALPNQFYIERDRHGKSRKALKK